VTIVIYVFASLFVVLALGLFFAYVRTRHVGLFLIGVTYGASGVLAFAVMDWWPLAAGFLLAWALRMVGLDPWAEMQRHEENAKRDG